jgi:xylulokinase
MSTLLAIDLGSTHFKAALFNLEGARLAFSSQPVRLHRHSGGFSYFDPQETYHIVLSLVEQLGKTASPTACVALTGMAETGLLIDRGTGEPLTPLLPWFDKLAVRQADFLRQTCDLKDRFLVTGLRPSFKCPLAKILWLKEQNAGLLDHAIWLGAPEYLAYRLSGYFGTDPSLATRTCAYDLTHLAWDVPWLEQLGIPVDIFAPVLPSGSPVGRVNANFLMDNPSLREILPAGAPVTIAGHDHICGAFAGWALSGAEVGQACFDSIGTAESLVGIFPARLLNDADWEAGFSFGMDLQPMQMYWASGLSTAGASIDWLRGVLGDPPLTYLDMDKLLKTLPDEPGELIYLPYLSGRGAPQSNPSARGALIGLSAGFSRADLYRAVLNGVVCEVHAARHRAIETLRSPLTRWLVAGGGVRNSGWMQIKADLAGIPVEVMPEAEATLLGAALLGGLGCGIYPDLASMQEIVKRPFEKIFYPNPDLFEIYQEYFSRWLEQAERNS